MQWYVDGMKKENASKGDKNMKTLILIVKLIDGYERHYRNEETGNIEIVFVERPSKRGK